MTEKNYLYDPATEGTAIVRAVRHDEQGICVVLDQTWFHPQGGGQKSDVGTIGGVPVVKVANGLDGEVIHVLSGPPAFAAGDRVDVRVDAALRLLHARWHTAGHLIASIGESAFPGLTATAGHQWPGEARVDFLGSPPPTAHEFIGRIAPEIDAALARDLDVRVDKDSGGNRVIRIGEFLGIGCGGTHVTSLSKIGGINLRKVKVKGSNLRAGYDVVE